MKDLLWRFCKYLFWTCMLGTSVFAAVGEVKQLIRLDKESKYVSPDYWD